MVIKDFSLDLRKYNLSNHDLEFAVRDKLPEVGNYQIALIVPDHTRPFYRFEVVLLNAMLEKYGHDKVDIFVATGMHRQSTLMELERKWGPGIHKCRVVQNNPVRSTYQDLFARNYYRIAYSNPMPHNHMGMSGGMKVVMPGLASFEETQRFHSFNRMQAEYWHRTLSRGIDFFIGCAYTPYKEPIELCFVPTYGQFEEWKERVRDYYRIKLPDEMPDVAILVPMIKGADIILAMNSLLVSAVRPIVKSGGAIAIYATLDDGAGTHYLFQSFNGGQEIWYDNIFNRELRNRELHFITDNVPQRTLQSYFNNMEVQVHKSLNEFLFPVHKSWGDIVHRYYGPEMMIGE